MEQIYKISCEFFVKAEDKQQVIEGLSGETDFFESHIIVKPSKLPENEEIWDDYTEETERNEFALCIACQNSFKKTELNNNGLCEGCELQDRE